MNARQNEWSRVGKPKATAKQQEFLIKYCRLTADEAAQVSKATASLLITEQCSKWDQQNHPDRPSGIKQLSPLEQRVKTNWKRDISKRIPSDWHE
jgi:hypothetical protein